MNKKRFSWPEYTRYVDELSLKISSALLPANLVLLAIGRGGYIPGVVISHALDKPLLTADVKAYTGTDCTGAHINSWPSGLESADNILLIDDIYETGATMQRIATVLNDPNITFYRAAIFDKHTDPSLPALNFSVWNAQWIKDTWLILPYEKQV